MVRACTAAVVADAEVERVTEVYSQIVGVILFITSFVRVDAAWASHFLTRYLGRPGNDHLALAKRVLGYLVRTHSLGLLYRRSDDFNNTGVFTIMD